MKHQYFGDVNDYLKYGLLRCMMGAGFRLGVCWMLTPGDDRPDGRKIEYLRDRPGWAHHDDALFDALCDAVLIGGRRDLALIEPSLTGATFYDRCVPDAVDERLRWFEKAGTTLKDSDLVFLDPDNGIEVKSKPMGRKGSSKYIFWEELQSIWSNLRSLLVFQHFPREERGEFIRRLVHECEHRLTGAGVTPFVSANVLFLLLVQPHHEIWARRAAEEVGRRWRGRIRTTVLKR